MNVRFLLYKMEAAKNKSIFSRSVPKLPGKYVQFTIPSFNCDVVYTCARFFRAMFLQFETLEIWQRFFKHAMIGCIFVSLSL
jgi:hypothetical protein